MYGSSASHCPKQEQVIKENINGEKALVTTLFNDKKFDFIQNNYEYHFTKSKDKWLLEEVYLVDEAREYKCL